MKTKLISCIAILGIAVGFSGCGGPPAITSLKSPYHNLNKEKCFNLPSIEFLKQKPIHLQNLYSITKEVIDNNGIKTYYGNENLCNNYLFTDFVASSKDYQYTSGGNTYTNTYGNIYSNSYGMGLNSYGMGMVKTNSYSYTTPTTINTGTAYYGHYTLEVGTSNGKKLTKVWSASQSGRVTGNSMEEAEEVLINDEYRGMFSPMIVQMLKENNYIK